MVLPRLSFSQLASRGLNLSSLSWIQMGSVIIKCLNRAQLSLTGFAKVKTGLKMASYTCKLYLGYSRFRLHTNQTKGYEMEPSSFHCKIDDLVKNCNLIPPCKFHIYFQNLCNARYSKNRDPKVKQQFRSDPCDGQWPKSEYLSY